MKYAVFHGPDWIKDVEAESAEAAVALIQAEGTQADRAELISEVSVDRH